MPLGNSKEFVTSQEFVTTKDKEFVSAFLCQILNKIVHRLPCCSVIAITILVLL